MAETEGSRIPSGEHPLAQDPHPAWSIVAAELRSTYEGLESRLGDDMDDDQAMEAIREALYSVERLVRDTPATTLAGAVEKIRA